jgi:enediyne core biosynthesis thioesterase
MKFYEYKQIVGFEETNLTGNVYFTNYFHWQGRAREHFLRKYAPEILQQLEEGLALITLHCSCSFLDEVKAFDEVTVRMFLEEMQQNRIIMRFEYWRLTPSPIPECLRQALAGFLEAVASC